jgi:hypothetical protein
LRESLNGGGTAILKFSSSLALNIDCALRYVKALIFLIVNGIMALIQASQLKGGRVSIIRACLVRLGHMRKNILKQFGFLIDKCRFEGGHAHGFRLLGIDFRGG